MITQITDVKEKRRVEMVRLQYQIRMRLEQQGHPPQGAHSLSKEIFEMIMNSDIPDEMYLIQYEEGKP